jgi:hypothetical protein
MVRILVVEEASEDWSKLFICPKRETRSLMARHGYVEISLLNAAYEMFSRILFKGIWPHSEKAVAH